MTAEVELHISSFLCCQVSTVDQKERNTVSFKTDALSLSCFKESSVRTKIDMPCCFLA
jgi:hypothetical protein